MSGSTLGQIFRVTTFGESHGIALGAIVDGCPAGLSLSEEDLQKDLDRRKPGQSKLVTQRKESDAVKILSGIFEGRTTGTPIGTYRERNPPNFSDAGLISNIEWGLLWLYGKRRQANHPSFVGARLPVRLWSEAAR